MTWPQKKHKETSGRVALAELVLAEMSGNQSVVRGKYFIIFIKITSKIFI
jgi:hypothetical protein